MTMNAFERLLFRLRDVVGERYVVHRPDALIVYEYDGSVDKHLPRAVVVPGTTQELALCVALCHEVGIAVVPRGSGTGLSGGAVPTEGTVQIVTSRLRSIIEVDAENRIAIVEPGVINADLSIAVESLGLYYVPDPSSQRACSIGGNVAENSGGIHCLKYGVTTNNLLGLEMVLMNGETIRLGGKHLDSGGYDLLGVVTGSEGLLGVITEVTVRILRKPATARALLIGFPSIEAAGECVSLVI
ncbi:MAG: FAD-binding protein, partial [Chloroflexi bacterium]|nr:FAD-binding protein [Chloroflexota bacterium]